MSHPARTRRSERSSELSADRRRARPTLYRVIPRTSLSLTPDLPEEWRAWVPTRIQREAEEGFGFFRDTWVMQRPTAAETKEVLASEDELVPLLNHLSQSDDEFDELAEALENEDPTALPEKFAVGDARALLDRHLDWDGFSRFGGIEVGVAGLVYALSHVGCWTAASCRGHPPPRDWAEHPVVFFTTDEFRASALVPLVEQTSCGLGLDTNRSEFLIVIAESIIESMALARLVFDQRSAFRRPRSHLSSPRPRESGTIQGELFS